MSELTTITYSFTKDGSTVTDTHDLLVDKVPVSLAISGSNSVNEGGNAVALVATVTYTDATTAVVSLSDWASDNPAVATIGSSTGILTSAENVVGDATASISGSYTEGGVTVTAPGFTITVVENVARPASAVITGPATVNEGDTTTYVFQVTWDDSSVTTESIVDWAADPAGGTINATTGEFTANADVLEDTAAEITGSFTSGSTTVNASLTITVIDTTNYPVSAEILGADTIPEGGSATYQLQVTFTDASTSIVPVTDWAIDNPGAGSINSTTGLLTAPADVLADEITNVTASYTADGVTVNATLSVTVENIVPTSVAISGPTSVNEGAAAINFGAIVTYEDATTLDKTASGTWSVDNTVGGTINASTGVFTPAAGFEGDQAVVVTFEYTEDGITVTDTLNLTVVDISLPASAEISGPTTAIAGDSPIQFIATVTFTDATVGDRTTQGTWSTSNPAAGTINPTTGVFTPVAQ